MSNSTSNVLFLSHGGGPLPLLGDVAHSDMVDNLKEVALSIGRPTKILVVSAHWEERVPTITGQLTPSLIYDYYGFPDEAYEIQYPAAGDPDFARKISDALSEANIASGLDGKRGFDHGVFVPLKIMYPDADIACVQLSLKQGLDASEHIKIGAALSPILSDGVLLIGSGFSFHNLKAFFSTPDQQVGQKNEAFEQWLIDTCTNTSISEDERRDRLVNWFEAPGARFCHPREEHLIPLHVCYGAASTACNEHHVLRIMNKKASVYRWRV